MVGKQLKNNLKDIGLVNRIWSASRRRQQDRLIENEQKEYEDKAVAMGIPLGDEPVSETYRKLRERLALRGLNWPPAPMGRPIHVVFATHSSRAMEQAHIPPEICRIGRVTEYYADDRRGVPSGDIIEQRKFVDLDLLRFIKDIYDDSPIDVFLSYLSGSHVSTEVVRQINHMGITTLFFHQDDRLIFSGRKVDGQWTGCRDVCSSYDLSLSNAPMSLVKYRVEGGIALFWPSAADRDLCKPRDLPFKYDVSFVGAKYGRRPSLVKYLRKNGVNVECFGPGWENGPLTPDEMMDVYAQSRINLGFGYVGYSSYQCLKGRDFEVPICGTVYLTSHNEDLPRVYRVGREIVTYRDKKDCLKQIRELLANPERCAEIRVAARKAGLERHTRETRFRSLLECKASVPDF